ncbi:hypothetical protein CERZMDRAFT_106400 [Cercospora zeae-maydis SCOH1-5]|uniref:Uncharacterized protein n=1 Tax=Cercospora zeae-maydis SCOH1-5 TaxID=717836 RepID=A0A6A6FDW1_9PEZI|nr:hypothetical protein CERZMDRAFT_106400 [Cercospora zeae-maydis SCOH1-5]
MALQVATIGGLPQRDIPPATTSPSDEKNVLRTRVRRLVGLWEQWTGGKEAPGCASSDPQHVATKDLWKPTKSAAEEVGALPSYEECVSDLPPDYNATGALAYARCMQDTEVATNGVKTRTQRDTSGQLLSQACDVKVDFNCEHGYRAHAKKKKQAAKVAAKSKCAESDSEEKKDEAPAGGDDNGAGGGGDGAGGAGDPPGGNGGDGGGDDGDEWNTGGGKKNRKGKKKQADDEDEQEKAAEEESPAVADTGTASADADPLDDWGTFATVGKKKKPKKSAFAWDAEPEPEAPVEPVADPPPAAAETPAEDDGGSFATVGKKGKKSKKSAIPEPVIEPEQPSEPAVPEPAIAEDDWASFGKKDKKKKKGKNEPATGTTTTDKVDMKFDDINLDDDKGAPKLDLDFGLGKKEAPAEEKSASAFSFGGWGGGWRSGSTWGFGSSAGKAEADTASEEETKMGTGWGFTPTSKSKKSDMNSANAFEISFDSPAGEDADLSAAKAPTEEKAAEDDAWSGFTTAKDKKSKKKKGLLAPEATTEPEAPQPVLEPAPTEVDPWATFTTGKKDQKSKLKKGALPDPEPTVVVPEPAPEPEIQPVAEKAADEDAWSGFTSAKEKKGKKKSSRMPDAPPTTFDWSEEPMVEVPAPQEATAVGGEDWFGDAWSTGKKNKKQLPAAVPEPELQPEAIVEPITAADDDWANAWSTGTKKKSSKKTDKSKGIVEVVDPSPGASVLLPESVQEKSAEDDPWGSAWTTGKRAKTKPKKGAPVEPPPLAALPAPPGLDGIAADDANAGADLLDMNDPPADDLWSFTATTTKKKQKGAKEAPIVEAPLSKSNTKDSKTSSKTPPDDILDIVEEPEPEPPKAEAKPKKEDKVSSGWGGIWGGSTKKETPKEKKAREKREKEEREAAEAAEAAEAQRIADEEAEAQRIADEEAEAQRIADEAAAEEAKRIAEEEASKPKPKLKESTKERKAREKREKEEREAAEAAEAQRIADEEAEAQRIADEEAEAQRIADEAAAEEAKRIAEEEASKPKPKLKESTKERKAREKREKEEREAAEAAEARRIADEEAEAQRIADEEAEAQRIADEEAEAQRIADEAAAEEAKRLAEEEAIRAKPKIKESTKERKAREKREAADAAAAAAAEAEAQKTAEQDAFAAAFGDDEESKPLEESAAKADGWSFWGASLKSSKKATPAAEMKKDSTTNQELAVDDASKKPDILMETDDLTSAMPPLKTAVKSSKTKTVKGSSVRDRVSAFGGEALPAAKGSLKYKADSFPSPPEPELAPELDVDPIVEIVSESAPLKKFKRTDKADKSSKTLKDPSPPPPPSISPVPGGFPVDDLLDDIVPQPEIPDSPPKKSSKDKKSTSKSAKALKQKDEPGIVPPPPPPEAEFDELLVDAPAELQTPPPEETPRERKSTKKDRPKVLRDDKSASWGFWGATPVKKSGKKTSEAKGTASPTKTSERPSGLSRSKSARKTNERDPLDKDSKSSESETPQKQSKARPSTSRGMSFGGLFGTPQPTRAKSTKISSSAAKSRSRRHSTAVEDTGLISPPPEMSAKAAKVTGVSRSRSTREKKTRMIPDPYPIDSDDMIMVDVPEDSAKEIDDPRDRKKSSRSRRHHMSGGLGNKDEEMMDAQRGAEDARIFSGTDDVERPAPPRRSSTMKKAGLMGGILGAFGAASRPAADRRPNKYDSEDAGGSRRKRDAMHEDDGSKRLRREDRKVHRSSHKASEGDGLTDFPPVTDIGADEAREARRRERRERRAREEAEEAERNARREERRRARAKEEEDRQIREDEERRVRRRARRAEEERLAREEEQARAERHERRRQRAAEDPAGKHSRPTTDRRRSSYMDAPEDEEARRVRREERRMRRSVDVGAGASGRDKDKPRTSRRHSEYPEDRNGEPISLQGAIPSSLAHAIKTGGDKTSSWVHSVNDDPPPPPPIEGTIIDAPVHFAADNTPDALDENETTAREFRHRRERRRERDDDYGHDQGDDYQRHRRHPERSDGIKSSSGEGSSGRRKSHAATYGDMYGGGMRTFDGRPSMPQRSDSKRGSWFKKIAGL